MLHQTVPAPEKQHTHVQAVVDKSAPVASAVLVSAMHMLGENTEVVKRWSSEIQEVVQSKHGMVQFHAVSLLHALRAKDRLAVSKLVSTLVKGNIRSPLAQCMLVRYVARVSPATLLAAVLQQYLKARFGASQG